MRPPQPQQHGHPPPRRTNPLVWVLVAVGVVVVLVAGLVVVAGVADVVRQAGQPGSAAPSSAGLPSPDAEERRLYLRTLELYFRGTVKNPDGAVSSGQEICRDIREGKSDTVMLKNIRARWAGDDADVSLMEAKQILGTVHMWCSF